MSSIWTKTAIASAALISMAALPAFAQSEIQDQPTEAPYEAERQSKPDLRTDTPRELRLRTNKKPPARCHYGGSGGTKADAEAYCGPILQCQPPKATHCQYRQNNQDWICWCK